MPKRSIQEVRKRFDDNVKLTSDESKRLSNFFINEAKKNELSKSDFKTLLLKESPNASIIAIRKNLRIDGKQFKLKNDKFKVISRNQIDITGGHIQFVGVFDFKLTLDNKTIKKRHRGFTGDMRMMNRTEKSAKIETQNKALAQFLKDIGWTRGSKSIINKIQVTPVNFFYIHYIDSFDVRISKIVKLQK